MTRRAINFDNDLKVNLDTFFALEPGDATRYHFGLRPVPNGVMGWSRNEPLWEITLYDAGGRNGSSILFPDIGRTIHNVDLRFPSDGLWHYDCTRRAALALINHVLGNRDNPYAGPFSGDRAIDGYSV
jgi:hypothetical protein